MTGSGKEAGLADIRLLGGRPCLAQLAVDACEFSRPLGDAQFQRFIRLFERHVGRDALGYVGVGRDDALVGHGIASDFEDAGAAFEFEQERLVERQEVGDQRLLLILADIPAAGKNRDDVGQRKAHLSGGLGEIQEFAEAAVPDDEIVGVVEDGNALVHLRECRMQHVLVVLERLACLIEQPGGVGGSVVHALQDK